MNRMLFLRDIDADVLISCRSCGHEGVLPRAEVEARFGLNYPVLSIAPHFRCSNCNARDAESRPATVAGTSERTPAGMVEDETEDQLRATIAALQGLVGAARDETAGAAGADETFAAAPAGAASLEDEVERDLARLLGDIRGLSDDGEESFPAIGVAPTEDSTSREEGDEFAAAVAAPSRGGRPGLPERPFFRSRETRLPPPGMSSVGDEDDDHAGSDDFAFRVVDRDAPPAESDAGTADDEFALPAWMLEEAEGNEGEDDRVSAAPTDEDGRHPGEDAGTLDPDGYRSAPKAFSVADLADEADDEDPLLSGALRRLLHDAPRGRAGASVDDDDDDGFGVIDDGDRDPSDAELVARALGEVDDPGAEDRELTDEELVALAVGEAASWSRHDGDGADDAGKDADAPTLMPAWDDGDDEDEVYEYRPDEIVPVTADVETASDDEGAVDEVVGEEVAGGPTDHDDEDDDDVLLLDMALEVPADRDEGEGTGGVAADVRSGFAATDPRLIDTDAGDDDDPMVGFDTAERWRARGAAKPGGDDESMEDALATLRALIEEAAADPEPDSEAEPEPEPITGPAPLEVRPVEPSWFDRPPAPESDAVAEDESETPAHSPARYDEDAEIDDTVRRVDPSAMTDDVVKGDDVAGDDDADVSVPAWGALGEASFDDPPSDDLVPDDLVPDDAAHADASLVSEASPEGEHASDRKGGLDDTLARLRGLLDLDAQEHQAKTPRAPVRRRK